MPTNIVHLIKRIKEKVRIKMLLREIFLNMSSRQTEVFDQTKVGMYYVVLSSSVYVDWG